jgi:hypothetical protein
MTSVKETLAPVSRMSNKGSSPLSSLSPPFSTPLSLRAKFNVACRGALLAGPVCSDIQVPSRPAAWVAGEAGDANAVTPTKVSTHGRMIDFMLAPHLAREAFVGFTL